MTDEQSNDVPMVRFLGDLQRLEVKPGDRFVLNSERHLSREQCLVLQRIWQEFYGDSEAPKLLILDPGMKLGAISAA